MPRANRTITAADILTPDQYELIRADKKAEALSRKKYTRLAVGPNATVLFETWDSMWLQVHEMLRIEKGGADQLADELRAYNPLVPNGRELTCTLLFEVEDPLRRDAFLRTIGGIERHIALQLGAITVAATPEDDVERTRASDNKASAVHFLHFAFAPDAIAAWRNSADTAMLVIDHPNYGHAALIGPDMRAFLTRECF